MAVGPPVSIKTSTGFTILCLHDPHYTLAHLALINDSGSRDDLPVGSGVTHCLEHLLFKGTRDRNTFQVLSELENKGRSQCLHHQGTLGTSCLLPRGSQPHRPGFVGGYVVAFHVER